MIIDGKRYKRFQVFKVKGEEQYIYAFLDTGFLSANSALCYDVCAPLTESDRYPHCHGSASHDYLYQDCRELSFAKCPDDIKAHLREYVKGLGT